FAPATDVTAIVAAVPAVSGREPLPTAEELVARAERSLPELAALRQDVQSADFAARAAARRPIPEPEIVAGTKASDAAGRAGGRRRRHGLQRPPRGAAVRPRETGARAGAGTPHAGARAHDRHRGVAPRRSHRASRDRARTPPGGRRLSRCDRYQRDAARAHRA